MKINEDLDSLASLFNSLASRYQSTLGVMGIINQREGYKMTQILSNAGIELSEIINQAKDLMTKVEEKSR